MWLPEPSGLGHPLREAATRGRPYKQDACVRRPGGRVLGEVRSRRPDSSAFE